MARTIVEAGCGFNSGVEQWPERRSRAALTELLVNFPLAAANHRGNEASPIGRQRVLPEHLTDASCRHAGFSGETLDATGNGCEQHPRPAELL
jgi:hypothetical protein